MKEANIVATIAGTDPSGGAGIQADIKAIAATGGYAASIITALVAQNTQGVQAIEEVSPAFVMKQMESVFNDLVVKVVKIGMLNNEKIIAAVAAALEKFQPTYVVLDPVMVAKSGCALLNPAAVELLKNQLFPFVNLITPNLLEAEVLIQEKITSTRQMEYAAKKIGETFRLNVLLKGGHLTSSHSSDVLYHESKLTWFHADRIETKNTHGTGCSLSAAIASYLAQNYPLTIAVEAAKNYLTRALHAGSQMQIGRGCGPVDHFYHLSRSVL